MILIIFLNERFLKILKIISFDGARLSEYFQKTKNSKIKDAVFNVSQLTLFEKVSSNLNKGKQNYISKQKTIKPKLGQSEEKVFPGFSFRYDHVQLCGLCRIKRQTCGS